MVRETYGQVVKKARASAKKARASFLGARLAGKFAEDNVLILTSSPRSGSTMLGQALRSIPASCVLFEPLHLVNVPGAEAANFTWRTFVPREDKWPEGEAFLRRVFEGRVMNEWTTSEMTFRDAFRSGRLIVKFVRANRLLPWICGTFDIPAPVYLLRHPCAVVASQLNYGWKNAVRPEAPPYLDEFPVFREALSNTAGDEEFLAALWALDQLPPLLQEPPAPWTIVTYEELVLHPRQTLERIFNRWNFEVDIGKALSNIKMPSRTVSNTGISGIGGWKKKLTEEQVSRVLRTVGSFGLDFYTESEEPDYEALGSAELSARIRDAGTG